MSSCNWELRNVLEHAVAVSSGPVLLPQHLPPDLRELAEGSAAELPPLEPAIAAWLDEKLEAGETYQEMSDALETMALRHLLARFDNKPTVLARETKMNRVTLRRKCRDFLRA